MKRKIREYSTVYAVGSVGYGLLELLWRGRTHWTMLITGGICFMSFYGLCGKMCRAALSVKCALGSAMITVIEFAVGCTVNLKWKMGVWDYSQIPFNIKGQICLPFTALWFLLCIPLSFLCDKMKKKLCKKL